MEITGGGGDRDEANDKKAQRQRRMLKTKPIDNGAAEMAQPQRRSRNGAATTAQSQRRSHNGAFFWLGLALRSEKCESTQQDVLRKIVGYELWYANCS
jgi:hypothetical protein